MTGPQPRARRATRRAGSANSPAPLTGSTDRPASIADVALFAGVSPQTVSRVVNGHPSVSDLTRSRVLAAIDKLAYRPNPAARALASGKSRTLGVVALGTGFYGPASTLLGIEAAAQKHGYFVSVATVHSTDRGSVRKAIERLTHQSVDALALIAPYTSAQEAVSSLATGVPVVVVEGDTRGDMSVVAVDQALGARLATEHLLEMDRGTVFHIAGPQNWLDARGRAEGWRMALRAAGARVNPPIAGDWTARSGYEAGQVLAQVPDARAIFVGNDSMALGALLALHEHGRRVPDDVALVGFDDSPDAAYFCPPLTTVRQDFAALGETAVRVLLEQLRQGGGARHELLGPTLVVRQSTTAGPWAGD